MIIRRERKPRPVRAIVRRSTAVIGEKKPRAIVKRTRGGVIPPREHTSRPPRAWRPPKRWLWGTAALLTLALIAGGGAWLYRSPVFRVTDIQVVGNQRTSADSVVETANLLGESMFTADLISAQKDLYKLPLVASVKVEREWPSTLTVILEERQVWGTWEQGSVDYTIDREGVVLGTTTGATEDLPLIRSSEQGSRRQGDRVDYQAVDSAAEIYEKLPRQLGTTVTEVAFVAGKGVQVTTADNQTALFGDSSSIAYKLSVWAALAQQARVQKINYTTVDLRYGNRPVLQ